MNIAVLTGGISSERNVALKGGKAVYLALKSRGHNVVAIDPALGLNSILDIENLEIDSSVAPTNEQLKTLNPKNIIDCINNPFFDNIDFAFLVLHGKYGEDGTIQSLLELRGIPYSGSKVMASSIAIDKATSKMLFQHAGIPTPMWHALDASIAQNYEALKALRSELGDKIVVKPNDQGSTVGLTMILDGNLDDLGKAITLAGQYSSTVIIEQYISGREITVPVMGDQALPIIEIAPKEGFYDYKNKYTAGQTEYICPAVMDEELTAYIQNLAVTVHHTLNCKAYSRVDFRLDEDNMPWCLEINTIPGFTELSLVPMSARQAGIEYPELCEIIMRLS